MIDGQPAYPLKDIKRLLLRCGIVALPYPDPQRPGCYRIPLCGQTAQGREALIDADAVSLVQRRRWRFAPAEFGRGGEVQTMIPSESIGLHYVVMGMTVDDQHLAHRNDDPLDCREHWTNTGENPPVGLILCAQKDSAVAKYALEGLPNKVMATEYRTTLPDENLLAVELEKTRQILESRRRSRRASN